MPSSVLTLVNDFKLQLGRGKHDLGGHSYKAALSNVAPNVAWTVLADVTQIGAGSGYTAGGFDLDTETLTLSGGTAVWTIADELITAVGGTMATFQYLWVYNDTQSSPVKPLVGYYSYGSPVSLGDGESVLADFDGVNGVMTIAG
ncbi:MAG: hypothetical protein EOP24_27635 [Hyphomicrobiales bacterium]|nr:MAG: hypothetical protein EOP24_27635 [Hyphomicrobiales bacterium]